jgi:hypothetical protein
MKTTGRPKRARGPLPRRRGGSRHAALRARAAAPLAALLVLLASCAGPADAPADPGPRTDLPDAFTPPDTPAVDAAGDPAPDRPDPPDVAAPDAADVAGDAPDAPPATRQGFLQFRVRHNLQDPSCDPDCHMELEDRAGAPAFLARIRQHSDLAVLHWDGPIPWLAFAEAPPEGADPIAFHDARLDAEQKAWIDAFADHFAAMDAGYLAVSILSGARDRYQPLRLDADTIVALGDTCPPFEPGTTITVPAAAPGAPADASFDLLDAYARFVAFLCARLAPDHVALLVEVNLFRKACPERWPGMVAFYRALHDRIRAAAGPGVPLFATLTVPELLAWDEKACFDLAFSPCSVPAHADYPAPDPAACFPLDPDVLRDLDEGGRLDVLALSLYADSLSMAPPGLDPPVLEVSPSDRPEADGCWMHAPYGPFVDPLAAIDRLGWTKPVAIAEWSARSCPTLAYLPIDDAHWWARPDGRPDTQRFWMSHVLSWARARNAPFAVWSFLEDYDPLPRWLIDWGIVDWWTFSSINIWPCSGLLDADGEPKPGLAGAWRPDQAPVPGE